MGTLKTIVMQCLFWLRPTDKHQHFHSHFKRSVRHCLHEKTHLEIVPLKPVSSRSLLPAQLGLKKREEEKNPNCTEQEYKQADCPIIALPTLECNKKLNYPKTPHECATTFAGFIAVPTRKRSSAALYDFQKLARCHVSKRRFLKSVKSPRAHP